MILSVVVYYLRRLDHLFWRILCQIRIIKYCAEPSVREYPSTRVVFKGEQSLRNCYESRRPPRNTIRVFRRYITAQIKLLELRTTLSDEKTTLLPNEVHKEVFVHSSIFAASRLHCHYRPFRRDYQMDQSSAYSNATGL